jgi:hypothetical protein
VVTRLELRNLSEIWPVDASILARLKVIMRELDWLVIIIIIIIIIIIGLASQSVVRYDSKLSGD